MDDKEYQSLLEKRAVHDLVLAMSTESFQAASTRDLWLRSIILILATFSVVGSGWPGATSPSLRNSRFASSAPANSTRTSKR